MTREDEAVKQMSELLALKCGYSQKEAERIKTASALHDIGKQKLPKDLLSKPSKLTPEEFKIMKMHTKYGEQLLLSIQGNLGKMAREIALLHHEKHNGRGYWGYKSSDLPLYINIVSICDVACALLHERSYKPP